ncbi:MAG TPA: hypothetical protein VK803_05075 [Steroidobacteraceae bacterium]|jgi:hypothetical protein|nr:hypothetical protein [Steroidobacteraceae bacterium]
MVAAAGAAFAAGSRPVEYLDEETGATVAVVGKPLVFARESSGFAGDYVTLAAVAVDRSGELNYVLVGYIWSAGAPREPEHTPLSAAGLVLQADDRRIELTLQRRSARELGIGVPVHRPPFGSATSHAYAIDLATMQVIADCHHLSLYLQNDSAPVIYELFQDRRDALKEFVRFLSARD